MTEQDWLISTDPAALLTWLTATKGPSGYYVRHNDGRPISARKLRLFACACCRAVWPRLADERSRRAVLVAERYVDGLATDGKLNEAERDAYQATFVGPDVAELLHSATVAVVGEVPLHRLWHAVPSYPTISEVWLRLLEAYRDN